jgi:hypothetical protein
MLHHVNRAYDRSSLEPLERVSIEQHLSEAHARLSVTAPSDDGSRVVTLAPLEDLAIRLTQLGPNQIVSHMPPFWLEIFSAANGSTIDGCGLFDLDESGLATATEVILEAQQDRHDRIC